MPVFKINSPKFNQDVKEMTKQFTQSSNSAIGLVDLSTNEIILGSCDTDLNILPELRREMSKPAEKRGAKPYPVLITNGNQTVTSMEVYQAAQARSGKVKKENLKFFAIHYRTDQPTELTFSELPYDLNNGLPENNFIEGIISTDFNILFSMLRNAMMESIYWQELDNLVKETNDEALSKQLKKYDIETLREISRLSKSSIAAEKYFDNSNHIYINMLLGMRLKGMENICDLQARFAASAKEKEQKVEVEVKVEVEAVVQNTPVMISEDCLEDPASLVRFLDPVVTVDGQVYDREYITKWLNKNDSSPYTNASLSDKTLTPLNLIVEILNRAREERAQPRIEVEDLICKITGKFMKTPVLVSDGRLFDKDAIEEKLNEVPRAKDFEDLTPTLLSVPWVNARRDELLKANLGLVNSAVKPVEAPVKSNQALQRDPKEAEQKRLDNLRSAESLLGSLSLLGRRSAGSQARNNSGAQSSAAQLNSQRR